MNKIFKRIDILEKRNLEYGIRLDRHEKVDVWSKNLFKKIILKQKEHIFSIHPNFSKLYSKISKFLKIPKKNILVTSGIDGATKQIFETFVKPKDYVIYLKPTWRMYEVYSSVFKTNSLHLDINEKEFKISLEQLKLHLKKKPKLLFLSIPNSPVEVNLSDENIKRIINLCNKSKCIIVFDEAYYGFGIKSQVSNYKKYKNIIINRSFSKSFGLPSIRLGYLISNPKFIKLLKEKKLAYETNTFSSIISQYFLDNYGLVKKYNKEIINNREWLKKKLEKKKFECYAFNSIQLLIKLKKEKIKPLISKLKKNKIYVKGMLKKPFDDSIVITIGKRDTMIKFYDKFTNLI